MSWGVLSWHSGLRIWFCHCSGSGGCCGTGSQAMGAASLPPKKSLGFITIDVLIMKGGKLLFLFGWVFLFFQGWVFLIFFRATSVVYGSSQARGHIRAAAATYATATATRDLSHVCNLHHSSWQCHILNPLSEAKHQTCMLMDTTQVCFQ